MLFTIGHSNHASEEFVHLLKQHEITAVCDVRSQPYSRYNPQFNRETLAGELKRAGIEHVFLGDQLGARVDDPSCHREGRVDYEKVAETEFFKDGLDRVRQGMCRYRVVLMCAEKDPITCHRMMLVSRYLRHESFDIHHIQADGSVETNQEAEGRLLAKRKMPDETLFHNKDQQLEEAYARQGRQIALLIRELEDVDA